MYDCPPPCKRPVPGVVYIVHCVLSINGVNMYSCSSSLQSNLIQVFDWYSTTHVLHWRHRKFKNQALSRTGSHDGVPCQDGTTTGDASQSEVTWITLVQKSSKCISGLSGLSERQINKCFYARSEKEATRVVCMHE